MKAVSSNAKSYVRQIQEVLEGLPTAPEREATSNDWDRAQSNWSLSAKETQYREQVLALLRKCRGSLDAYNVMPIAHYDIGICLELLFKTDEAADQANEEYQAIFPATEDEDEEDED
jgi:hypothetical protein